MNCIRELEGDFMDFRGRLENMPLVIVLIGKRGSGKSASAYSIIEELHTIMPTRPVWILGFPENKKDLLPDYFNIAFSIHQIPIGAIVLIDEGAKQFNARRSMSSKAVSLSNYIDLARQNDWTMIVECKRTRKIDLNVIADADMIFIKGIGFLQEQFERNQIRHLSQEAKIELSKFPKNERIKYMFIADEDFKGVVNINLPSFWTDELSRAWKI